MPPVVVIIIALVVLITLHELGHFLLAKKYGVKVEEFGIGIPPRLFGKKVGETIYSLNLIPLGGFVRLYGEDKKIDDKKSFSSKPVYQRALIVFGGVAAFFVIAFFIFSALSFIGYRTGVSSEDIEKGLYEEWQIVVSEVMENSPAEKAGIEPGDELLKIGEKEIKMPEEAISLLQEKRGEEVELEIRRRGESIYLSATPREEYDEKEGALGIGMALMAKESVPLYYAPVQGAKMTAGSTVMVFRNLGMLFHSLATEGSLPRGAEVRGPVGIVHYGAGFVAEGFSMFLHFVGMITIFLAVFNLLPIPALDGGRLVFLAIERVKGASVSEKVEQGLTAFFFLLIIGLILFVTYRDVLWILGG